MDYDNNWNDKLNTAAKEGDLRTIQAINEYACVAVGGSYALQLAARHNQFSAVEYLLQFSSPEQNTDALLEAIDFGRVEMVRLLLPKSRPKSNRSEALCYAVASENQTIIDLVFPKSRPDVALQRIFEEQGASDLYCALENLIAQRNKVKVERRLKNEISNKNVPQRRKI